MAKVVIEIPIPATVAASSVAVGKGYIYEGVVYMRRTSDVVRMHDGNVMPTPSAQVIPCEIEVRAKALEPVVPAE